MNRRSFLSSFAPIGIGLSGCLRFSADRERAPDWSYEHGGTDRGSRVVRELVASHGLLFLVEEEGSVLAIRPGDGREWESSAPPWILTAPAVVGNRLLVGNRWGSVSIFETETGHQDGRIDLDDGFGRLQPIVATGETALVGTYDGTIHKLDHEAAIEVEPGVDEPITGLIPIDDGMIATGEDGTVRRITDDGKISWELSVGEQPRLTKGNGELVYVGSSKGLTALDSDDGETLWTVHSDRTVDLNAARCAPTVTEDGLYVTAFGDSGSSLFLVDFEGGVQWEQSIDPATEPPVVYDGVAYTSTLDGTLYAIEDGEIVWVYDEGRSGATRPYLLDETVYHIVDDRIVGFDI